MDSLKPADMPAVLERTNLAPNLENFLLPLYEAVSNAIYSAEAKWGDKVSEFGRISLEITTASFSAKISDNGLGLNEDNYGHFLTPFTSFRLKKGGKGFGRFIAFKVFESISYVSNYDDAGEVKTRNFDFDIYSKPEIKKNTSSELFTGSSGCSVLYRHPKEEFSKIIDKIEGEEIVERVIRYFLPFFLTGRLPEFEIKVDGVPFDAKKYFSGFFKPQVTREKTINIKGADYLFTVHISKVKRDKIFTEHVMLLFADGRIIGTGRKIEGKIGKAFFENATGEKQVYVATVSGDFLDTRANTARTQIEAEEDEVDLIVDVIAAEILFLEKDFVESHRLAQQKNVKAAIIRNPLLRTGIKGTSIEEYVASKPMSWKAEAFVSDLALHRYRDQGHWEKIFEEGLKAPEKLIEMRKEIFSQLDTENKDALASYVSHRKSVLQLAEKILEFQEDGKMSKEDMFHDLVHPRYEDSETTKFYQHNLWLLDERLAFFSYCSSDRTLAGGRRKKGDKIADILFFDECSIYKEGEEGGIVLVEFKRPGKDDYKFGNPDKDPVQQVIETAVLIRETGRIITTSGTTIPVADGIRLSAYIVADIEPSLHRVCESHDMKKTWDGKGYYRYHETKDVFIEVMGYGKLMMDAKKRNAAFFDVLLGDIVS